MYFFALLATTREIPDPLDLDQWKFHVLSARVLDEETPTQRSVCLAGLKALGASEVSFSQLSEAVKAAHSLELCSRSWGPVEAKAEPLLAH